MICSFLPRSSVTTKRWVFKNLIRKTKGFVPIKTNSIMETRLRNFDVNPLLRLEEWEQHVLWPVINSGDEVSVTCHAARGNLIWLIMLKQRPFIALSYALTFFFVCFQLFLTKYIYEWRYGRHAPNHFYKYLFDRTV